MEIERKFLVKEIPSDLARYPMKKIMQGYISTDPVLRLRQSDDKYIFTYKGEGQLAREEFESSLTKAQFEKLWPLVTGNKIVKDRYCIPLENGLVAELDIYHQHLDGLTRVEVEFASIDEANAFTPPDWFGEDVTFDEQYSNSNLSKSTTPFHLAPKQLTN